MIKLLIIEDDTFLKELEIEKFNKKGFEVITTMTVAEIETYLVDKVPDVILLDLMLPDVDGFQILALLKSNEKTKDTPIFIFSNVSDENEVKKAMDGGAKEFLIKSNYTLDELIEKLSAAVPKS
jgi:two-component system alkaline phosphatase synthesis response regulator PhoP